MISSTFWLCLAALALAVCVLIALWRTQGEDVKEEEPEKFDEILRKLNEKDEE